MAKLNWNNAKKSTVDNGHYQECFRIPTTFISGIYQGKNIGSIIKAHPEYIIWILDNQPKGKLSFQIVEYINHYGF